LFRDYLRANGAAARAYAQIKVAIARCCAEDPEAYYDIKDPVCDIISMGAEAWAKEVAWQSGCSDC
jgi:GrpB-like predicted nucleotidyltransferase (UPF0157 family)